MKAIPLLGGRAVNWEPESSLAVVQQSFSALSRLFVNILMQSAKYVRSRVIAKEYFL